MSETVKWDELKSGDVFTVNNSPTYPKLKLTEGYVDMRDLILNKTGSTVKDQHLATLTNEEVASALSEDPVEIKKWVNDLRVRYAA